MELGGQALERWLREFFVSAVIAPRQVIAELTDPAACGPAPVDAAEEQPGEHPARMLFCPARAVEIDGAPFV